MFIVRTKLAPSPIHGIGVFADEPIQKGQVIWSFDPRLDLVFTLEELDEFPRTVRDYYFDHCYSEIREGREVLIFSSDDSKYMNHSDLPNTMSSADNLFDHAVRAIREGEELTCDYYTFDLRAKEKLGHFSPGK